MVGRADAVDRLGERLLCPAARIRARLEQIVQALIAESLDLDRPGRSGGEPSRRGARARARGARPALRPRPRWRPSSLPRGGWRPGAPTASTSSNGVVAIGALGEGPRGEDRGAAPLGGFVDRAVLDDEGGADQRPAGQVGRDEGEAVGESDAFERREVVGPRNARRRACVDHGPGHAALSTSSAAPALMSAASGVSSAPGGPTMGTYVMTTRLSARNTSAATSRICSAVTER